MSCLSTYWLGEYLISRGIKTGCIINIVRFSVSRMILDHCLMVSSFASFRPLSVLLAHHHKIRFVINSFCKWDLKISSILLTMFKVYDLVVQLFWEYLDEVLTDLENLENLEKSGNFPNLESSGKTHGIWFDLGEFLQLIFLYDALFVPLVKMYLFTS